MIRILFLAANPANAATLLTGDELRDIEQVLKGAPYTVIAKPAARLSDLRALLLEHSPQIVHFSGHGSESRKLLFVDDNRMSQSAPPAWLADLFGLCRQWVRCVVLNACYSDEQAKAIGAQIDCVLGFAYTITDQAACAFSRGFYTALANGATLTAAKNHGLNEIKRDCPAEEPLCQLVGRADPATMRPLDWNHELASPPNMPPFYIPFHRKSAAEFVGREAELVELHDKLQHKQVVGVRPPAALTGMGGIGKTRLAVEYAYHYQADYPGGTFWLNVADLANLRAEMVRTAERMGLRNEQHSSDNALLAALVEYCQRQPATLLIFDNALDATTLQQRISQELSVADLGAAVLVTTRNRTLPKGMAALDLRRLGEAATRQFLLHSRSDLASDPQLPQLLARLAGLPLLLNLAAAALRNRPDLTIADYLEALDRHSMEEVHEDNDASLEDYDLYRGKIMTHSLLPALHEQWQSLPNTLKGKNAQQLFKIASQLPEAAEIPLARLGLLAGLRDEKAIRPIYNAMKLLWEHSLIEELKEESMRLHPLVRDFAESLTPADERVAFRIACAQRLADEYCNDQTGMQQLGDEYTHRGIAAILLDLNTALELCQPLVPNTQTPVSKLEFLRRLLHLEADKLQGAPSSWQPERLWQQLLLRTFLTANTSLTPQLDSLLRHTLHWRPRWWHQRQSQEVEQTLSGHEGWVLDVAVLDAQRIVSASSDHTLKVWNLDTGQAEPTFIGHEDSIDTVVKLGEQRIASASRDGTLKIWNLATSTLEQTLADDKARFRAVAALNANCLLYTSDDRTLKIWNLHPVPDEQILIGPKDKVDAVAVLDDQRIVYTSDNGTLKVWNLATGALEQEIAGTEYRIDALAVIDANRIVYAANDRVLAVWHLTSPPLKQTLTEDEHWLSAVAVLDANCIVSATRDRTLNVWNLQTGKIEQTLSGHGGSVNAIAKLDAHRIVSASDDRTLKIWNLHAGQAEQTLTDHKPRINAVAKLDTNHIVSASSGSTLKIWNIVTGELEQEIPSAEDSVDDETEDEDDPVAVLDDNLINTGELEQEIPNAEDSVDDKTEDEDDPVAPRWFEAVAVLDDKRIVAIAEDQEIRIYTVTGKLERRIFEGATAVAVLDADHIVSASSNGTLKVWKLNTGEEEQIFEGHEDGVNALAVIDEQRIVAAGDDGTLKIWNLQTGENEYTLTGHTESVRAVAVLDATRIVSGADDHMLKVWNLDTGENEHTLSEHTESVRAVAVLDATRIVSGADDRTLKVWNLHTGQVIASIGLDGTPQCVAVVQQEARTLVVTGDAAGSLYCLELIEGKGIKPMPTPPKLGITA